jgi:asparagine synthetase B (glutamine-hydrolysing)
VQVVALLFKKLGPTFMSKLRGVFTFAVYDSNVGRVLAANDCNGSNALWQGHVDDCLVVACNVPDLPDADIVDRTAIAAGEYKFGWRAAPIAYMASQQTVQVRCNEAMQAAMAALAVRLHVPTVAS